MAEQNRESSMEEILSSIKRIIAEDKVIDEGRPLPSRQAQLKPALQAVPDFEPEDQSAEVLELTNEVPEHENSAVKEILDGHDRDDQLIDDNKLDSMRQSLSALVEKEALERTAPLQQHGGTSLEDMTRELMRPMIKDWLDKNLPDLVEKLVAREIERLRDK